MRRHRVHLQLRFPPKDRLHVQLKTAAKHSKRSLNSEILTRLQQSFAAEDLREIIRDEFDRRITYWRAA